MKSPTFLIRTFCFFFFASMTSLCAQKAVKEGNKDIKVVKKTIMERYEPGMILAAENREQLKKERLALIQHRRRIIDTLDISERKKRRLLKELYSTPHSYKWDKLIADLQFEHNDEY